MLRLQLLLLLRSLMLLRLPRRLLLELDLARRRRRRRRQFFALLLRHLRTQRLQPTRLLGHLGGGRDGHFSHSILVSWSIVSPVYSISIGTEHGAAE